jgi:hypothetical protein
VFFSQETKRRIRHKRNKEPKRKKKNRHRSLHSLSHMNTTEGETKRNHETKKRKKKTDSEQKRTLRAPQLRIYSAAASPLSLSPR